MNSLKVAGELHRTGSVQGEEKQEVESILSRLGVRSCEDKTVEIALSSEKFSKSDGALQSAGQSNTSKPEESLERSVGNMGAEELIDAHNDLSLDRIEELLKGL